MSKSSVLALVAYLGSITPAFPAVPAGQSQSAVEQSDSVVSSGRPRSTDIVVEGHPTQASSWKDADSQHFVLLCDCDSSDAKEAARGLERLFALMSRLYRKGDTSDPAERVRVIVLGSSSPVRISSLGDGRGAEGPYVPTFAKRYYNPGDEGELIVVSRSEQLIPLNTHRRFNVDCDEIQGSDAAGTCVGRVPFHPPIARSWKELLYSSYAQHFLLTYLPSEYPRWYMDGIGALFSTISPQKSGATDYAQAPTGYRDYFKSYGYVRYEDVLTGRYLSAPVSATGWSPYSAWLLVHYFFYSALPNERRRQIAAYMNDIRQGVPMATAAGVFGDMKKLQRDIERYAASEITYSRAKAPERGVEDIQVTALSTTAAAVIEPSIELSATFPVPVNAAPNGTNTLRAIETSLAGIPDSTDARLLSAEAQCRAGNFGECIVDVDRVLGTLPDNVQALTLKGTALTDQAIVGAAADRPQTLATARKTIARAMELGGGAWPSIAYFQSFIRAGERAPEQAMIGIANAIRSLPAAPGPRLYLGQELIRQGQYELGRRVLHLVAYGPYDSPERKVAETLSDNPAVQ